jgi:hypothetical protein
MLYGQDGYNQFNDQPVSPQASEDLTWLDYIILSNPQGVMKVLAGYGYTGYLAPRDNQEMIEACQELMDKYGEAAVIDLLKSHPLYDAISEVASSDGKLFKNATGDSIISIIKTINYQSLIENALIIIGAFYIGGKLWSYFTSE